MMEDYWQSSSNLGSVNATNIRRSGPNRDICGGEIHASTSQSIRTALLCIFYYLKVCFSGFFHRVLSLVKLCLLGTASVCFHCPHEGDKGLAYH